LTLAFPGAYGSGLRESRDWRVASASARPARGDDLHDVLTIGGGPAGLTASLYCRMRKLSVLVVDAGVVGGQLVSVYGDKPVHDWPGHTEVVANELATQIIAHARELNVEFADNEKVEKVTRVGDHFEVVTRGVLHHEEHVHSASAVIIAIGAGTFEPRRLHVPGEEGLSEDFLTYRLPEAGKVAGRRVVVVGGGDSGLESAQVAHRAGASVTIVHTHAGFKGMQTNIDAVSQMKIPCLFDTRMKELVIEGGALAGVIVHTKGEPEPKRIDCDYLVVNIGAAVNLDSVQRWGVEVEAGHIKVDGHMQTSVPGLFACGDIVTYEGKFKLLLTASSEGAVAANSAYVYVKRPLRMTMGDLYT
jgi:thioredoxin reductase (NADPH)